MHPQQFKMTLSKQHFFKQIAPPQMVGEDKQSFLGIFSFSNALFQSVACPHCRHWLVSGFVLHIHPDAHNCTHPTHFVNATSHARDCGWILNTLCTPCTAWISQPSRYLATRMKKSLLNEVKLHEHTCSFRFSWCKG